MALPVVRTRDEAHLYLDLHPCEHCDSIDVTWEQAVVSVDGELASEYAGQCPGCGAERDYVFALPERETLSPEWPNFGGPEPSQLLDAGEWLWVAELSAGNAPPGDPARERQALAIATRAVAEVVKFIPAGEEVVPDTAFWSARGRELRDAEPGRFNRGRLLVVQETYDRLAGQVR
ncbi:MAG: hypothetical protein DLM59_10075 [Pseudonocardiales bacterium]|nr:MAG: hypothetical protein DLM59_10075 [Pseudonocardiales bacterium]